MDTLHDNCQSVKHFRVFKATLCTNLQRPLVEIDATREGGRPPAFSQRSVLEPPDPVTGSCRGQAFVMVLFSGSEGGGCACLPQFRRKRFDFL